MDLILGYSLFLSHHINDQVSPAGSSYFLNTSVASISIASAVIQPAVFFHLAYYITF